MMESSPPVSSTDPTTLAAPPAPVAHDPHATQDFDHTAPSVAASALPRIPGYEILAEVGRGGMGVVYRARQETVNRLVALKMVLGSGFASTEARLRFLMEGEVLGLLQHPNIVQIHEVGTHEGHPYFVLEYVDGGSLADLLRKGHSFAPLEAAELVETLARAVHHAHVHGVIHRDLKPANILLSLSRAPQARASDDRSRDFVEEARACGARLNDIVPKITDFGLAKQTTLGTGLTATGAVMGTPNYMAPEQAEGKSKRITPATDVYALGATLYELLTGQPPFSAETALDILIKVVSEEPPSVSSLRPKVPRDLATICHKCLEKEPAKRYATAEALAEDLRRFREDRPIHARPVRQLERAWRWCRRNPVVAGLLASVVLSLVAGTIIATGFAIEAGVERDRADQEAHEAKAARTKADEERNEARRLVGLMAVKEGLREADTGNLFNALLWFAEPMVRDPDNPEAERMARLRIAMYRRYTKTPRLHFLLHLEANQLKHIAFSRDGRGILAADRTGRMHTWDVQTGQPDQMPLRYGGINHSAFSPEGRSVVLYDESEAGARVIDTATGQPQFPLLQHRAKVWDAAFSPDGRWVVTASADQTARLWDATTGQPRTPPLPHADQVLQVVFSPDGRWVATGTSTEVRVWDAATGKPRTPSRKDRFSGGVVSGTRNGNLLFSPDSRRLLVTNFGSTCIWDIEEASEPVTLEHLHAVHGTFSPDGRRVVTAGLDGTAKVWDAESGFESETLEHQVEVRHAVFSPDGRWIVTASGQYGRPAHVRVWDATTGQLCTVPLKHEAYVDALAFSPDGRRFLTVMAGEIVQVWDAAAILPQAAALSAEPPWRGFNVTFSRDRRQVVGFMLGTVQVWDVASGQPRTPPLRHDHPVSAAAFSPDGRWVVTVTGEEKKWGEVHLWDAATGQRRMPPLRHSQLVNEVAFSPDSRWLATAGGAAREARVWDVNTGQPRIPAMKHENYVHHVAFSPDGAWVVTTAMNGKTQVWNAATGQPRTAPFGSQEAVGDAEFSPDGRWVVVVGVDTAQVWDAVTGQPRSPPLQHEEHVQSAVFSADSRWVATASHDRTARVWDAATGLPRTPPLPHDDEVLLVAFSPDDRCVATAAADGTTRLWDAATGLPLSPPLQYGPTSGVDSLAFSPEGRSLLTVHDGSQRRWEIFVEDRPKADLLQLCQVLAKRRIDKVGGMELIPPEDWETTVAHFRARYPDDFRAPFAAARRWREAQIAACVKEGNLVGAFLHQDWLVAEAIREQAAKGK